MGWFDTTKWNYEVALNTLTNRQIWDDMTPATEHYEKFLDLRKNADPGIAEVEDARKRLAGLKSQ